MANVITIHFTPLFGILFFFLNHVVFFNLLLVLVEQYTNYDVSLNDMWVMRGSTAVLRCVINPPYVTEYVKVIGWTRGDMELRSGQ